MLYDVKHVLSLATVLTNNYQQQKGVTLVYAYLLYCM